MTWQPMLPINKRAKAFDELSRSEQQQLLLDHPEFDFSNACLYYWEDVPKLNLGAEAKGRKPT